MWPDPLWILTLYSKTVFKKVSYSQALCPSLRSKYIYLLKRKRFLACYNNVRKLIPRINIGYTSKTSRMDVICIPMWRKQDGVTLVETTNNNWVCEECLQGKAIRFDCDWIKEAKDCGKHLRAIVLLVVWVSSSKRIPMDMKHYTMFINV